MAVGPCLVEASTVALLSHFLMELPWIWGFILGFESSYYTHFTVTDTGYVEGDDCYVCVFVVFRFVLGAVSPAVVVPSMLLLQKEGYGVEQGVPTLLMAAGSFDDVLAITGFTTCLGIAFATGN